MYVPVLLVHGQSNYSLFCLLTFFNSKLRMWWQWHSLHPWVQIICTVQVNKYTAVVRLHINQWKFWLILISGIIYVWLFMFRVITYHNLSMMSKYWICSKGLWGFTSYKKREPSQGLQSTILIRPATMAFLDKTPGTECVEMLSLQHLRHGLQTSSLYCIKSISYQERRAYSFWRI